MTYILLSSVISRSRRPSTREKARASGLLSRPAYRQADIDQLSILSSHVTSAVEGDEIFSGDHNRKINLTMRSKEELNNLTDCWYGCCYQGPQDLMEIWGYAQKKI